MAFKRAGTMQTLTWLDCYGLYREAGASPYMAQEQLDAGSAFVMGTQADLVASGTARYDEQLASVTYAGEAIAAIGAVVLTAAGASVPGAIVGALLVAVGAILSFFASWFVAECDEYHCGGYDRNTETRKKTYRSHLRTLVGVYIPDSRELHAGRDCSCDHSGHECTFVRYMHDGLIVRGQNWGKVEQAPAESGVVRGANAIAGGGNAGCVEYWRTKADAKPLTDQPSGNVIAATASGASCSQDGCDIPIGDKNAPWSGPENSYYYRAWKVKSILKWMTGTDDIHENLLCRTMECMEEVLLNTKGVEGDSDFNQKRRRGSRWYASIVHMMDDIWTQGTRLGWEKFGQLLVESTGWKNGSPQLVRYNEMAAGHVYDNPPWPWYPFFEKVSFEDMRRILIGLKPHFIYETRVIGVPLPEGEAARARNVVMKPILMPPRGPIAFNIQMRPVPAKLGSRGASWGTIALGVGAAAIGSYAIYKALAPSEEE